MAQCALPRADFKRAVTLTAAVARCSRWRAPALGQAAAVLLCGVALAAIAAEDGGNAAYPSRPLHIVVPQTPGGAVDLVARRLGARMAATLDCAVVIENRPGANGVIGTEAVKNAAPDGYTLLAASSSTHAMAPHTMAHIPYAALDDFAPIVNVAYTTKALLVHPALPVRTLAEFIAYARERPGRLNYGSTGRGSSSDLDAALFAAETQLQLVHVPYRGSPQENAALANNEVQLVLGSLTSALGLLQAGKLRALAVVSARRAPLLPDVPTMTEAGLPDFDVQNWIGLVAPAGTPEPVVEKLNHTVNAILREASMQQWMDDAGLSVIGGSAQQFALRMRADYALWGDIVQRLGLQPR